MDGDSLSQPFHTTDREFERFVDRSPDIVVQVARDGLLLFVNRAAAALFARDARTLVGTRVDTLELPAATSVGLRRALRRCFAGRETSLASTIEIAGRRRQLAIRVFALRRSDDDAHPIDAVWVTACDVTDRLEATEQRDSLSEQQQTARANVEAAIHARDRFLAIVSHELRSPLNGIQSWSHVLESQLGKPDRASTVATRALEGIRAGIDQQVKLIDHLLDATVALTGDLSLEKEAMVVRESIEAAVAELRSTAIAKDVAFHVDMRLVDERMDGDPHRMRQVFTHLLSNALKFTPRSGSVWLSARVDATNAVIVVRDSGRGWVEGFEQWLFEPFRHADNSNTRRSAGIGLGLALARRLTELHGGQVKAESPGPHLGSTFTVSLPLMPSIAASRPTLAPSIPPRSSIELHGLNALVIDDQYEAREALSALLGQFGASVQVAASSRDGLALIDRQDEMPDVVICDIAMPEEDGYGFAQRFREYEAAHPDRRKTNGQVPRPRIPVIALSAFAQDKRGESLANHFDCHLKKPVSPRQLLSTLVAMTTGR